MSINWGEVAASLGAGAVHGFQTHKAEKKAQEQLDYDRGRQAAQDQRAEELHKQTVKQNEYTLQSNAREQAEASRKQLLSERLGMYQNFKTMGDIDRAAATYVDFANKDNVGNPNFDQNHALSYVKNDDGTVNINIVDRNTGSLVRTAREGVSFDDFVAATYQQLDPTKSYESQVESAAKSALKHQEYVYDIGKENNKHKNAVNLEGVKHGNNLQLEGVRQGGANYRAELSQEGQNWRALNNPKTGKSAGNSAPSKAVVSNVQGAINFAKQNAPMLATLQNNPAIYNKTLAMMAIESGGQANATSYDGSSYGLMQLNKTYAHGFAKQFGIQGDPLTNPQANFETGAALITHLDGKYQGDVSLIAAAYNAGEPAIDRALNAWEKSGRQGHWFDHLDLKPAAKQQVYGHIVKYGQALGLLDGNLEPSEPPAQNHQAQTAQAKSNYRQGMSAEIAATMNGVAKSMSSELELGDKPTAAVIGGLASAQTQIAKFASSQNEAERRQAYGNIFRLVDEVVKQTEAGAMMTPAARKEYVHQKTADLVGATSKSEAGSWITKGRNQAKAKPQKQQGNLSTTEIDNVFGDVSVSDTPAANPSPAAKPGQAFIPMRNPGSVQQNPLFNVSVVDASEQLKKRLQNQN